MGEKKKGGGGRGIRGASKREGEMGEKKRGRRRERNKRSE